MKKSCSVLLFILCALFTLILYSGDFSVTAHAELISTSELEYFELNKPLCVFSEGDVVYIAEKELVVIYHNDTYDKIDFSGYSINQMQKCGNHLLILSNEELFSLNLATHEVAPILLNGQPLNTVHSFAVNGLTFAVNYGDQQIALFEVYDSENFLFTKMADVLNKTVENSPVLALSGDLSVWYFSPYTMQIHQINNQIGMQGPYKKISLNSIEHFQFEDKLYYKANDVIYSLGINLEQMPQTVVDLTQYGISGSGDFFIYGNKILVCDTAKNRVIEYDISLGDFTGFEISFTKISLPENFALALNTAPTYINVVAGVKLYDINLVNSFEKGYFVFNGYYSQEVNSDYLVIDEISGRYYLIAGDCIALVMKEDYQPTPINQTQFGSEVYLSNDLSTYLYPRLTSEFLSLGLNKHQKVTLVSQLSFRGVDYSIISCDGLVGYVPSSFILSGIYTPPAVYTYKTATTYNHAASVYSSEDLSQKVDSLSPYSKVVILSEYGNCYQVKYGNDQIGFVSKNEVVKRGTFTVRIVIVVILVAIAFLVSCIHFELKYLYAKRRLKTNTHKNSYK